MWRLFVDAESSRMRLARPVELLLSIDESTSGAANDDEVQHSLGIRTERDLDIFQCVSRAG